MSVSDDGDDTDDEEAAEEVDEVRISVHCGFCRRCSNSA